MLAAAVARLRDDERVPEAEAGSAAIQGGAKVTTLITTAAASASQSSPVSLSGVQHVAVAGDPRQQDEEDERDDRVRPPAERLLAARAASRGGERGSLSASPRASAGGVRRARLASEAQYVAVEARTSSARSRAAGDRTRREGPQSRRHLTGGAGEALAARPASAHRVSSPPEDVVLASARVVKRRPVEIDVHGVDAEGRERERQRRRSWRGDLARRREGRPDSVTHIAPAPAPARARRLVQLVSS